MATKQDAIRIVVVAARRPEEAKERTDSINASLEKAGHKGVTALTIDEMHGLIARVSDKYYREEVAPKAVVEVIGLSFGHYFDDDGSDLRELQSFTAMVITADMLPEKQLMNKIIEGPAGLFDTSTVAQVRP